LVKVRGNAIAPTHKRLKRNRGSGAPRQGSKRSPDAEESK
jgi:hypothetical protein